MKIYPVQRISMRTRFKYSKMKKILVPTDFSANAMKAAIYSAEIARRTGAIVYLLHVIEPVTYRIRRPYPLHERLEYEIEDARMRALQTVKDALSETSRDVCIETAVTKGFATKAIVEYSEHLKADIVVMGTKGATGLKEIFVGSVAASVIAGSKIPVLAVPEEYIAEMPANILFATNHFEENNDLLNCIVGLAKLFTATIYVAIFIDTDSADASQYLYNTRQLNHYLDFLQKAYPEVAFKGELLEGRVFEDTLNDYEKKQDVDIVAMITYPKSFWEKKVNKSMSKKLAFHSSIPLLVVPAKQFSPIS